MKDVGTTNTAGSSAVIAGDQRAPMTAEEVRGYVLTNIGGFVNDPPDTDFQKGFLSAFLSLAHTMDMSDDATVKDGWAVYRNSIGEVGF